MQENERAEARLFCMVDEAVRNAAYNDEEYSVLPLYSSEGSARDIDLDRYIRTAVLGVFAVKGCSEIGCFVYDDNMISMNVDFENANEQITNSFARLNCARLAYEDIPLDVVREFVDHKALQPDDDNRASLVAAVASYASFDNQEHAGVLIYNNVLDKAAPQMGLAIEQRVGLRKIIKNSGALALVSPDVQTKICFGIDLAGDALRRRFDGDILLS